MENFECFYGGFGLRFLGLDRVSSYAFSKEWETECREHAESQSFWNEFFHIFGISRRRVASFEESVKNYYNLTYYSLGSLIFLYNSTKLIKKGLL